MINGQTAKRADEVTADHVLIAHFLYVLFVVGSLPVIWIGAWLKFRFVANPWFRYLHLAAILFVVTESLLDVACPLTVWENNLRQMDVDVSFIQLAAPHHFLSSARNGADHGLYRVCCFGRDDFQMGSTETQ